MSKITVTTIAGATSAADANKVKIESGDTLEVVSNATVGGDLTVDTSTLKVDSSNNNVGIGETSPLGKLHIKSGDSAASSVNGNANELVVENSDYTGITVLGENETSIMFGDNEDPDVGRIVYFHGTNTMSFMTNANNAMHIDSAGRVTKPLHPAFSIGGGPNSYRDSGGNETVILHGQSGTFPGDMNIGGHFSYSNGRFTAPIAGNYMFTYTLTSGDTNSHFIELRKNNASQNTILLYTTIYQSGCHSAIMTLAANDYVTAQRRGTSYGVYSAIFSGFLIG